MSQSGYTPIQLYRTTSSGAAPDAANLSPGELAININDSDMALYAENASGVVKRLMNNPAGLKYPDADGTSGQAVVTNGAGQLSFTSVGSGDVTLNGVQTLTNKTINIANNTLTGVQATLVSGTNIKTVGGVSLLGSGDVPIPAAGLTLLATLTPANGVTTVTATSLASSKSLLIVVNGITVASNSGLNFAVSANGGGSFGTNFTFTSGNGTTPRGFAQVFRTNESSSAKPYYLVNVVSPDAGQESSITGVIDAVRISLTAATTFTGTGSIYIYGLN